MNHNRISNKKINDIIKILSINSNNSKFIENNEYTQNKCIKDYKNNLDKIKQKKNMFSLNIILKNIQNNIRSNTKIDNNIRKNKLPNDYNFNTKNIQNNIPNDKSDEKSIQKEDFTNKNDIITKDIVKTVSNYKTQTNITQEKLDVNTNIISKDIVKTDSNNKTHTNIDKSQINITTDKLNLNTNNNKNLNKSFTYKNYYKDNSYIFIDNKLICNIFENHQNIQIKSNEPIVFGICILIYKKFLYLNNSKRDLFIKELKYIMAVDLDRKNLYEKFKYNHKRFKKTEFQNDLIENKTMNNEYFYMYIGDYFNINIIFKDNDLIKYFNNYNSNRYSLLIINFDNDIYVHYNCDNTSLLSDELCIKNNINLKMNITKKTTKNNYNNLKISDLQNMAKSKNIDIKKQGKTSLINKTKKELIDALGLNPVESAL